MFDQWTLEDVDRDGAIQETAEKVAPDTRAGFLKKAGIGLGAVAGSGAVLGALPSVASAAFATSDIAILNYALTLEYLEATFYAEAKANDVGSGLQNLSALVDVIADHEAEHVKFLQHALGAKAVKKPKFDFRDTVTDQVKFMATAQALEDTGVQAILGQAGNIKSKAILAAAGSILAVEARHAAWIRDINGNFTGQAPLPAPAGFEIPKTKAQALAVVKSTGFIVG